MDYGMSGSIRVHGHVGGRVEEVLWVRPEGNGMRRYRVQIAPLHGLPGLDSSRIVDKTNYRQGARSSCCRRDLSDASGHREGAQRIVVLMMVGIRKQVFPLISRLMVIEGLIMRKWRGKSENV